MGPILGAKQATEKSAADIVNSEDADWLIGERPQEWWTGAHPQNCPGLSSAGTLHFLGSPNISSCSRQELLDYFDNSWTMTEVLFSALQGEAAFVRPPYHNLRHPMIFYYGHPAAVFINKARVAGLIAEPLNEYLEVILETGVDEMSWDDMSKNEMVWPPVREVMEYRRIAYKVLRKMFEEVPLPITMDMPGWALVMGIEHEHIHLETSSCLMRELPLQFLKAPSYFPTCHPSSVDGSALVVVPNEFLSVPSGTVELGKPNDYPSFGWDNEYGHRSIHVPAFKASKNKITNGEYLEFIKAGGYREERFWTAEGWGWRKYRNAKWATWWVPDGPAGLHQYKLRTLFDVVPLPLSWPVCVNCHEAKAYAAWLSHRDRLCVPYRLITEAEHNRIRDVQGPNIKPEEDPGMLVGGNSMVKAFGFNLALAFGSETPVNAFHANSKGFHDVMGNVWEWTEDDFNPLEGFKVHFMYDDFSVPCFDGKHNIIMAGSWISAGDLATLYSRYHFRPHFFQHAGFRLVLPDDAASLERIRGSVSAYSAATARLAADALAQFADASVIFPDVPAGSLLDAFASGLKAPQRCVEFALSKIAEFQAKNSLSNSSPEPKTATNPESAKPNSELCEEKRALVVESGAGGACAALAPHFALISAISSDPAAVDMARTILTTGRITVQRADEGHLTTPVTIETTPAAKSARIELCAAEATTFGLSALSSSFHAVFCIDALERMPAPRCALEAMASRVAPQGTLTLASSHSWHLSKSASPSWLGGITDRQGRVFKTFDAIQHILSPQFDLIAETDIACTVPQNARNAQLSALHVYIWMKRC